MRNILIIAAHPDDELLGCGGTIFKLLSRGCAIKVLFIGEGSSCRFDDPRCKEAKEAIAERTHCAIEALDSLGVSDFEFNDLPCGRLDQIPIIEINKIIERSIQSFKPDTVFTHYYGDSNNDHKIVYTSTVMATRPCGESVVKRVLCYEVLSSSEWSFSDPFVPNYFMSLEENDIQAKWQALSFYTSEMRDYPFPRSWGGVQSLAMHRGAQSGNNYAEAFHLIRELN